VKVEGFRVKGLGIKVLDLGSMIRGFELTASHAASIDSCLPYLVTRPEP